MPSPGTIHSVREPAGPGVRIDSGVMTGSIVPMEYDGLLAKVVAWGNTRAEVISRMKRALCEYHIVFDKTTIPFKRYIMDTELFHSGQFDTGFINEILDGWKTYCCQS